MLRMSEPQVRGCVESGIGCKIKVSNDLMAWATPYDDHTIVVYVGSKIHGRIVFEAEIDTYGELGMTPVQDWLKNRRMQHEADMAVTIKSGTAHIKDLGDDGLHVYLLSDNDNLIDQANISKPDLFEWLRVRLDW